MKNFKNKIKKTAGKLNRFWLGLKDTQVAKIIGVSNAQVANYKKENGQIPHAVVLLRMAKVWELDLRWLIDDEFDEHSDFTPGVTLTNKQLMLELNRRSIVLSQRLDKLLTKIEGFDWDHYADQIELGKPIENGGNKELAAAVSLAIALERLKFTPESWMIQVFKQAEQISRPEFRLPIILEDKLRKRVKVSKALDKAAEGYKLDEFTHYRKIEDAVKLLEFIIVSRSPQAKPTKKQSKE